MHSTAESGRSHWRSFVAVLAATVLAIPLMTGTPAVAEAEAADAEQNQYLLSVSGSDLSSVADEVVASGGTVVDTFEVGSALLVQMPGSAAVPAGATVVPDLPMEFQSAEGDESAGDAELPANTHRTTTQVPDGVDGSGVTVALIDTGVADTGELAVEHVNVSGGPDGDGLGHGTFLAGLIAGDGSSSDGAYAGAAPGANVLDVQVADPEGATSLSKVLAGLQAVSDRAATDSSLKVVNLALSTGSPLPPWMDPLTIGLDRLWDQGLTVVAASGNDGKGEVGSPASDPLLLAVGALDENKTADRGDDVVADFSAYNRAFGSMRPDVVAPGVSLVSLRAPGSIADTENPDSVVLENYFKGTGTSMSAAVTSGLIANLVAERPELAPNDVKRLLMGTAFGTENLRSNTGAGQGGVDLASAIATDVNDTKPLKTIGGKSLTGPSEDDAAAWATFAAAWESGDLRAAVQAWIELSPQTRRWAANAWSLVVLQRSLTMEEGDFEGRRWAGRRWATQDWNGRRWAEDNWVGRRWGSINWDGRRWSAENWDGRRWAGRRWAGNDWLAFAWTLRVDADSDALKAKWADEEWEGRRWAGRRWSSVDWAGRRWAFEAWEGRRWSDFVWDGRRWSDEDWNGRRWSNDTWEGRRWAGRRWSSAGWDGRRWSTLAWEGRRWATENWSGRRWSVARWTL